VKFVPFWNAVHGYDVQMTLVRARDLVAKDRNLITRRRTTSDPYVEVFVGINQRLGKTRTIQKTCNPEWNETFTFHIEANKINKKSDDEPPAAGVIFLKLYDEDILTDPDLMGTLVVPIPAVQEVSSETKWHPVENIFCQNATGEVEIKFELTPLKGGACFSGERMLASLTPSPETVSRWVKNGRNSLSGKKHKEDSTPDSNIIHEENKPNRREYIVALVEALYGNNREVSNQAPRNSTVSSLNNDSTLFAVPLETQLEKETSDLKQWLEKVNHSRGGNDKDFHSLLSN